MSKQLGTRRDAPRGPARAAPVQPAPAPASLQRSQLTTGDVLQLQRSAGNRAVGRLLGGAAGAAPGATDAGGLLADAGDREDLDLGGRQAARTLGEAIGDFFRPLGAGAGNLVGGVAAALTGIDITSTTTAPATWSPHGLFSWDIGFTTTGRSGWIVQEVTSTRRAEDAAGANVNVPVTPKYYEAWAVDAAGAVTPAAGATNDMWRRRSFGPNTKGHFSIYGKCYFTQTDPATQGFAAGAVPEAGTLLSSTGAPSGLGIARLHRFAQGTWDSTGATPTHTGRAGP